jgi:pimeloyl-ACP methyl ester carboxylesterase
MILVPWQPRETALLKLVIGTIAMAAILIGLSQLHRGDEALSITRTTVGETPVTIFRQPSPASAPIVVIAHGFAGSQQLMQPFAETLARNGYIAVTFDFLGHGRNPVPMRGDITEGKTITAALLAELNNVAAWARKLPGSDGRLAVLGHSMASDIVVRFAQATADVEATVAVSVFSPVVTASSPRNLLVIVGALEPAMLRNEGLRIVNLTAGGSGVAGETYGHFPDGTARKLSLARGVEHIGVLYSQDSMTEALRWFNAAFDRTSADFIDSRGRWLALVFLGIVTLAWSLSSLLPVVSATPAGMHLGWKPLLITAFTPALLTPLILWKMPTDFLPILLGDYLTLHFLLYGALTTLTILYLRKKPPADAAMVISWRRIAIATVAVTAYNIVAFGLPIDVYVFSFLPIPARLPLIAAIVCGTLPYFIADEWLTRGPDARRGAYALTKLCFLLSLAIAVALNPMKLFFLVIIVPAILLLFLAFGLISRWSYAATRHPLPGAVANAAVFAWGIAVTFPMIVR